MTRSKTIAAVLAAALAGCGDSDDDSGSGGEGREQAQGADRCVEEWNRRASGDLRAQASLSHRGDAPEPDVVVGAFTGADFSATGETYDDTGGATSAEVSVRRGDCVAVDLTGSGDSETNWVMVLARPEGGAAPAWHFLDEAGDHPLAKPPQPLDRPKRARITGFGREARLSLEAG